MSLYNTSVPTNQTAGQDNKADSCSDAQSPWVGSPRQINFTQVFKE